MSSTKEQAKLWWPMTDVQEAAVKARYFKYSVDRDGLVHVTRCVDGKRGVGVTIRRAIEVLPDV